MEWTSNRNASWAERVCVAGSCVVARVCKRVRRAQSLGCINYQVFGEERGVRAGCEENRRGGVRFCLHGNTQELGAGPSRVLRLSYS